MPDLTLISIRALTQKPVRRACGLVLLAGLLAWLCLAPAYAATQTQGGGQAPQTTEFKVQYDIGGASNVYLAWGVDHWQLVDKAYWPADTSVKNKLLQTPMHKDGDSYSLTLRLPAGSRLEYGFFVELAGADGGNPTYIWDGDYETSQADNRHSRSLILLKNRQFIRFAGYVVLVTGLLMLAWVGFVALARPRAALGRALILFAANVVPVALALILIELYLVNQNLFTVELEAPKKYNIAWDSKKGLIPHPVLGWVADPARPDTNLQGFRDTKDFSQPDPGSHRVRVLVLGDSFVWGVGVDAEQNLTSSLSRDLGDGYEVYTLSMPGWGLGQMYAAYQMYKTMLDPDIVVMGYIDNDILRVLNAGKPNFAVHDGVLNFRNGLSPTEKILNAISKFSVSANLVLKEFYYAPMARRVSAAVLEDIQRDVSANGGKLLVVHVPVPQKGRYAYSIMTKWIGLNALIEDQDLRYIDLSALMSEHPDADETLYLDDPGTHLSVAGNRVVAQYLAREIKQLDTTKLLAARSGRSVRRSAPLSRTIRYDRAADGDRVQLVWGVNGWQTLPQDRMPAGSEIDGKVMVSPMQSVDGHHEITLTLPSGTVVDYNFKVVDESGKLVAYDNNADVDFHFLIK